MPLPKRQHSKTRGRKRRTHWKIRLNSLHKCPQCQRPILSHRVCPFCGFYKGRPIVDMKAREEKRDKKRKKPE